MENENRKSNGPRPAATVVIAREHKNEYQIYLLQRSKGSRFFPGNYVFPGGVLDPEDWETDLWAEHMDTAPESLLSRFGGGLDEESAIAYAVAVIRETFEEAGVFLAQKKNQAPKDLEGLCSLRESGELPRGWIRERVVSEGWVLAFSQLARWSHWITPEGMPRRFDTRFFLAFMPDGQACIPDDRETVQGLWVTPKKGLEGNLEGSIPLSPPTLITLNELLDYGTFVDLKREAQGRPWGDPRQPIFLKFRKGAVIIEPWDPMHGQDIEIDPGGLKDKVVPLGEPFSRIWLHKGIWRPIEI